MKAKNGSQRSEWLASYDPVVSFVARVRQEVDKLPDATQRALAKAVHDNGYWKGQETSASDNAADPFVGAKFEAGRREQLKAVLTPAGIRRLPQSLCAGIEAGTASPSRSVADRAAFYKLEGKRHPSALRDARPSTTIVNANAQSWDDLVADAQAAIRTPASGWE